MIHQVEANLLNPKIIGVAARLHPVLVVFSLIVGCGLMALVFYSSRRGYDDAAYLDRTDERTER